MRASSKVLSISQRGPKPLLVWCASIICLYFAGEAGFFLSTRYFHPLIAWVLFIHLAIAISLFSLHKSVIAFASLKLLVSFGFLAADYAVHGHTLYTPEYFNWLLADNTALLSFIEAGARGIFAVWLLLYSLRLYRLGYLANKKPGVRPYI